MTGFDSLRGLTYAQATQGPSSLRGMTYAQATAEPVSLRGMTYDQAVATQSNELAGGTLSMIGLSAQITGQFMQAIGAGFAAQAQKDQLKSQALTAEFQASMANHNARQAEKDAQAILAAGRGQVAQLTAQRGQERARKKVSAAARGVSGASVKELLATEDITKSIDAMTINRNAVRAAGQARMQSVNAGNQSLLAGVSAGNLRRSARSISPLASFSASSLAGAGRFAASYGRGR